MLKTLYRIYRPLLPRTFREEFSEEILCDIEEMQVEFEQKKASEKRSILLFEFGGWWLCAFREQCDALKRNSKSILRILMG